MRKNQLKKYLKLGILLFGISWSLTNCEKEFTPENQEQLKSRFEVKTLNNEQIRTKEKILKKLNELNLNKKNGLPNGNQAREIYNNEYGFTINTDFVKYIEDTETGNHSYSFPFTRENPVDDKVENLLLHSNLYNGYDVYIVQYGFTANEYLNLNETTVDNYTTLFFPIDFDMSVFSDLELLKVTYECNETWSYITYTGHTNGELHGENPNGSCALGCNYGTSEWVLTDYSCGFSGGGGENTGPPGSTGDNPDPTDPNNHNNGTNNPILSAPAIDAIKTDCMKLKNLMLKPVNNQRPAKIVRALLNELKQNTTTTTNEMGYYLNPLDTAESKFENYAFEGIENADETLVDFGDNLVSVIMHLHYNNEAENKKQLSVFSLQDIYEIYNLVVNNIYLYNKDTFTYFLTTEHGTNYAIQINDANAFVNSGFATKYFQGWESDNIRLLAEDRYSENLYNILPDKTNGQNELSFTKFLANENLGLTLFRANANFTEFTEIQYKNGAFIETPCN